MAQKKRKHGKVEARKAKPRIRFKLGVLLLLILIAFGGCFTLYMISATSQPDFWETEIVGSTEATEEAAPLETEPQDVPSAAVNPVPESERADEARIGMCAWVGDVTALTSYYKTASEMIFPDAVSGAAASEAKLQALADAVADTQPLAVYLWFCAPEDPEGVRTFAQCLQKALPETPVYVLSALPVAEDAAANQAVNDWNKALFAISDELGLHYVDVSTKLKGNDGALLPEYEDTDALHAMVGELILTHVAD